MPSKPEDSYRKTIGFRLLQTGHRQLGGGLSFNTFRKTIGFRLTLWYSGIFILSSFLLFTLAYLLLLSHLKQQDKEAIHLKLKELSSVFQEGGIASLEKELASKKKFEKESPFFIRLADGENRSLFFVSPGQWAEFDIEELERKDSYKIVKWRSLPASHNEYVLEIASLEISNGYCLQIGRSSEKREKILTQFQKIFAAVMIPLILIGVFGGAFLGFRALQPIRRLIGTIRSISTGKMDERVLDTHTGDELDVLIGLFNGMLEKIDTLIRAMKGSLDNIAHDLRTPMTRLRGMAERALQSGKNASDYKEALVNCIEESEQIEKMLKILMDISEAETGAMKLEVENVFLSDVAGRVIDIYRYVAEEKSIQIHLSVPDELRVNVDPGKMGQVFANLLDNAVKYTPDGGQIYLEARQDRNESIMTIRDTGMGISEEDLPRIWDHLYRGDQSRSERGSGLGLSLVKAVVKAHKGCIEVFSELFQGSTFVIHIPLNNQDALIGSKVTASE